MTEIYVDASYNWKNTGPVLGKICIKGDGFPQIIEEHELPRISWLNQYINLFELLAITRACEIACEKGMNDVTIYTDSGTAYWWSKRMKNPNSIVHKDIYLRCIKAQSRIKHVQIVQISREINKAGFVFEEMQGKFRAENEFVENEKHLQEIMRF